ncbi:MAG TPA: amidohydrolase family protein [Candidatus Thermoplasmatota archaeon]|nr:amidohydrolase family protein [Candidatus Thermoplasmatota archaeon]
MQTLSAALLVSVLLLAGLVGNVSPAGRPADDADRRDMAAPQSFDVLIRGGEVVDGTGAPRYSADVGITDDRIAAIGDLAGATATEVIDGTGMLVTPGFFDLGMGANLVEAALITNENMLQMGVTSGLIAWEAGAVDKVQERQDLERAGLAINVMTFFPVISAWQQVGVADSGPTEPQLEQMKALARKSFEDGAFGIGAAIEYCPLCHSDTRTIVELAKVGREYNVYYASHIRNEANGVVNATTELIAISEQSGIPGHVGHMKVAGAPNCGLAKTTTGLVEDALARGLDVSASQYPYTAGQTTDIGYLIPDWAEQGTEVDIQLRLRDPATRPQVIAGVEERIAEVTGTADRIEFRPHGTTLQEEADLRHVSPGEAVVQIRENEVTRLTIIHFGCDEDLITILQKPWVSIQSDMGAWIPAHDATVFHPRGYGTFPRVLGAYGRDQQLFPFEEAVRKMTGQPAYRTGIAFDRDDPRGLLQVGWAADVVVLDPAKVIDKATYDDPGAFSEGIEAVLVNGVVMKRDGELVPLHERVLATPGRYLVHTKDMPSGPQPGYDFRAQVAGQDHADAPGLLLPALTALVVLAALAVRQRR